MREEASHQGEGECVGLPQIEGGGGDMEASIATKWKVGEKGVKKGKKKDEELL